MVGHPCDQVGSDGRVSHIIGCVDGCLSALPTCRDVGNATFHGSMFLKFCPSRYDVKIGHDGPSMLGIFHFLSPGKAGEVRMAARYVIWSGLWCGRSRFARPTGFVARSRSIVDQASTA